MNGDQPIPVHEVLGESGDLSEGSVSTTDRQYTEFHLKELNIARERRQSLFDALRAATVIVFTLLMLVIGVTMLAPKFQENLGMPHLFPIGSLTVIFVALLIALMRLSGVSYTLNGAPGAADTIRAGWKSSGIEAG